MVTEVILSCHMCMLDNSDDADSDDSISIGISSKTDDVNVNAF